MSAPCDLVILLPAVVAKSSIAAAASLVASGALVLHSAVGESIVESLARQYDALLGRVEPIQEFKLSTSKRKSSEAADMAATEDITTLEAHPVVVYAIGDCRLAHEFVNNALLATCDSSKAPPSKGVKVIWKATLKKTDEESSPGSPTTYSVAVAPENRNTKVLVNVKVVRDLALFQFVEHLKNCSITGSSTWLNSSTTSFGGASTATGGADTGCEVTRSAPLPVHQSRWATYEILQRHLLLQQLHGSRNVSSPARKPSSPKHPLYSVPTIRCVLVRIQSLPSREDSMSSVGMMTPLPERRHRLVGERADRSLTNHESVEGLVQEIQEELQQLRDLLHGDGEREDSECDEWRDDVRRHLHALEDFVVDAETAARAQERPTAA